MSRAFVKEPDGEDAVEELPERPVSSHPNLVTAQGLAQIEAELARLQREHAAAQAANDRGATARAARDPSLLERAASDRSVDSSFPGFDARAFRLDRDHRA